jgi:beta-N-acetylglucosaminidase
MKRYCKLIFLLIVAGIIFCFTAFATSPSSRINIDTNLNNSYISSNLAFSGWSLNQGGVSQVNVYLDNKLIGRASIGQSRPDVYKAYPSFKIKNGGYSVNLQINTNSLAEGSHTLKVVSVGKNKSTVSKSVTMIYSRAKMCIDSPTSNQTIYSNTTISGWALNAAGTKQVNIFVDGLYRGSASYGGFRPDVNNAFPGYIGGSNCGYSYNLDINSISTGSHYILVQSVDINGKILSNQVNVIKANPLLCVDTNLNNINVNDTLSFGGWSLSPGGVKEVDVYLDNNFLGKAVTGGLRNDVRNVFPGYNNANSGFSYTLTNPLAISSGTHKLSVTSVANDGSTITNNFTINKLKPVTCIDSPAPSANCTNMLNIHGWTLNATGVKQVNIYVDSLNSGALKADTGISRPDVNTILNKSGGYKDAGISGYSYSLDISSFTLGYHTIYVQAIGFDGETSVAQVIFSTAKITNYNITLNDMIAKEIDDTPALAVNGEWYYADIQNNQLGYFKYVAQRDSNGNVLKDSNGITLTTKVFTASVDQYNAIKAKLISNLDPSQLINDPVGKYEFLRLSYVDGVTAAQLNSVLGGVLANLGQTFIDVAKQYNLNPVYLAGQANLETGNGTSNLANGITINGVKYYNLFGINAYDSSPDASGSQYACTQGWDSVTKALSGGAYWISRNYINASTPQDTLYKMRWDPNTKIANSSY